MTTIGITVCYFLDYLVEAAILFQFASTLFIPKYRTGTAIGALCCLYAVLFAVSMSGSTWQNAFLYLLANFVFLLTQYKVKWHAALFHSAILTAVMGICELAAYSLIQHFDFAPHFYREASGFQNTLLFVVFSKMTFFTVIYIFMHFLKDRQKCGQPQDHSSLLLVFIPLTSVFIFLTLLSVSDVCALPSSVTAVITLNAVLLLAANLLVFGIDRYNEKKNMKFTEMQLLLQKEANSAEYYQMLFSQSENQNILIHDIKKHLQSIDLLNSRGEQEKVSAYIRQLMLSSDLKETSRLCSHELLNTILCRYKRQCDGMHISFHADIRHGAVDFIAANDLTSLFGNLLDNAVEAAGGIPDSFIEINADRRVNTPYTVITVVNSARKDPFSYPSHSLATTKPDKRRHGFGIKSIRKTVGKYHGDIQMYYHADTLTFHTVITLKA